MSKPKSKSFTSIVVESLGWPLFWGMAATVAFYLLIGFGIIKSQLVSRYFAGHPVEYVETALFFVGVMALLLKAGDLAFQFRSVPETELSEPAEHGDSVDTVGSLLDEVASFPSRIRDSYLAKRLHGALRHVQRNESAEEIDVQLRYLSDMDAERSHEGYSLVRMIVWATPMLGFLGTVIGITMALGNLSPEALVDAPKEAMQGLLAGLSVAFDTTALALSLSIVLMFVQFLVREVETQLLGVVDRRAEDILSGRFQSKGTSTDPNVNTIRMMSEKVVESVEELTSRQAEIWGTALSATQRQWSDALQSTNGAVQTRFMETLDESMKSHAEAMKNAERDASREMIQRWSNVQAGMQEQASLLAAQHEAITEQGNVMLRVLDATGEVTKLETSLNQNLNALAGAKNFEDTVMSLSAAIQLLTGRLGMQTSELNLQTKKDIAA